MGRRRCGGQFAVNRPVDEEHFHNYIVLVLLPRCRDGFSLFRSEFLKIVRLLEISSAYIIITNLDVGRANYCVCVGRHASTSITQGLFGAARLRKVDASQLQERELQAYRKSEKEEMNTILDRYLDFCISYLKVS